MEYILSTIKKGLYDTTGSQCPVCGTKFKKSKGKKYCSYKCRIQDKHYPSIDEINSKYQELGTWAKVSDYFGISRRVLQDLRKP